MRARAPSAFSHLAKWSVMGYWLLGGGEGDEAGEWPGEGRRAEGETGTDSLQWTETRKSVMRETCLAYFNANEYIIIILAFLKYHSSSYLKHFILPTDK
jgi:hypothetical protein